MMITVTIYSEFYLINVKLSSRKGYEVVTFHTIGNGGRGLEKLMEVWDIREIMCIYLVVLFFVFLCMHVWCTFANVSIFWWEVLCIDVDMYIYISMHCMIN